MTVRHEAARLYAARIETEWEQTSDMDQVRAAVLAAAEDPAREQDLRALIDSCIGSGVRGALLAQCLSVIQDARAAAGPETTATEEPVVTTTTESPRPDAARKPACRITYGTRKDGMPVIYHDYPLDWRLSRSLLPHRGGRRRRRPAVDRRRHLPRAARRDRPDSWRMAGRPYRGRRRTGRHTDRRGQLGRLGPEPAPKVGLPVRRHDCGHRRR